MKNGIMMVLGMVAGTLIANQIYFIGFSLLVIAVISAFVFHKS